MTLVFQRTEKSGNSVLSICEQSVITGTAQLVSPGAVLRSRVRGDHGGSWGQASPPSLCLWKRRG